eukprot:g63180.t1
MEDAHIQGSGAPRDRREGGPSHLSSLVTAPHGRLGNSFTLQTPRGKHRQDLPGSSQQVQRKDCVLQSHLTSLGRNHRTPSGLGGCRPVSLPTPVTDISACGIFPRLVSFTQARALHSIPAAGTLPRAKFALYTTDLKIKALDSRAKLEFGFAVQGNPLVIYEQEIESRTRDDSSRPPPGTSQPTMGPDEDLRPGERQQDQRRPFPVAPRYLDQSTMKPLPERPSPRWDAMKIYDQETRDDPSRC